MFIIIFLWKTTQSPNQPQGLKLELIPASLLGLASVPWASALPPAAASDHAFHLQDSQQLLSCSRHCGGPRVSVSKDLLEGEAEIYKQHLDHIPNWRPNSLFQRVPASWQGAREADGLKRWMQHSATLMILSSGLEHSASCIYQVSLLMSPHL